MVRAFIARRQVERAYRGLREGDPSVALAAFRPDGRLHFAGAHSWAIDSTDENARVKWFERFAALRPNLMIRDILLAGPPWRMRVCVVFDDEIHDAEGAVLYRNHGVQYAGLRWGRIAFDEINLDTQRVADLDTRLSPQASDT